MEIPRRGFRAVMVGLRAPVSACVATLEILRVGFCVYRRSEVYTESASGAEEASGTRSVNLVMNVIGYECN